jgi:hypothetical protein
MDDNELRVEAALGSYPVFPLPPGFTHRVMAEIRASEARFRLEFLDFALPTFLWLFFSISLISLAWMLNTLEPQWFVHVQLLFRDLQYLLINFPYWPAVIFTIFGAAMIVFSSLVAIFALAPNRIELR